jgi:hypothetical protein
MAYKVYVASDDKDNHERLTDRALQEDVVGLFQGRPVETAYSNLSELCLQRSYYDQLHLTRSSRLRLARNTET